MTNTTVTLIKGDGIGPEITDAVKRIFAAANVPIAWDEENAGQTTLAEVGELIPASLIASIKKNKVALKGPLTTPVGKGFKSVNVQLRQLFDLYQNVRPCVTTPGVSSRFTDVNLVIFREIPKAFTLAWSFSMSACKLPTPLAGLPGMAATAL